MEQQRAATGRGAAVKTDEKLQHKPSPQGLRKGNDLIRGAHPFGAAPR